jgi:hypothetical protein
MKHQRKPAGGPADAHVDTTAIRQLHLLQRVHAVIFLSRSGCVLVDVCFVNPAHQVKHGERLRIVDELGLDDLRYLHSTRVELMRRLGRTDEARDACRRARQLTDDGAERRFLERRLTELADTTDSS